MKFKIFFLVLAIFTSVVTPSFADSYRLTSGEAGEYVGQTATVCGHVASTKFAYKSKGQPTFLNLDAPYPRQLFTVLIWGNDRPLFGSPETIYEGKNICATGLIKTYKGVPEIVAKTPSQISLSK
ncbi:MAG: DNA-binding protein [Gammaproteobacteria bacterium]|nr:DNA-binding protein [Gammaproteobacteria bacterium]MDR3665690.1 hypothetical protein [Ignavibacteriaceae bacterium]